MGLFSRKKKSPEPANPYANPITPYQQARNQLAQGPDSGEPGPLNTRMGSFSPSNPPPPYNQSPSVASTSSRFGDNKYGNQNGYGSNPYDANTSAYSANQRGPGGYGGLDEDAGQNALFGDAPGRYVPPQKGTSGSSAISSAISSPNQFDRDPNKSALLGNAEDRYTPFHQSGTGADDEFDGYGAPREKTAEEIEDDEVQAVKDETKAVRKEGVESINRTLAIGRAALQTGQSTLVRLGEQGDRLHRTERNLDEAAIRSRLAADGVKELRTAGNMVRLPGNPLTSGRRRQEAETLAMERHRNEREVREATRRDAYMSEQQLDQTFKELPSNKAQRGLLGKPSQAETNKFTFEQDSEDEADEEAINDGLSEALILAQDMNMIARSAGTQIESQNALLTRVTDKSVDVDDQVRLNRLRLDRIR